MDMPKPKLLIFIPCHKDYEMAFKNAEKLANQISNLANPSLEIEIIISINGVKSIDSSCNIPSIRIVQIEEVVGGDANIAKGYVTALETRPDYFWILSANEDLVPNALLNLQELFMDYPDTDLFVANAANRKGVLSIKSVFFGLPPKLALGLISGVVYNFRTTSTSFMQSTLFSWTGWGQLAVIQDILSVKDYSKVIEFPDSHIYEKPYTYSPEANNGIGERTIVSNLYAHSFFGLPVLAYCMLQSNPKHLKRFQREWLSHNWFKLGLFSKNATFGDEITLKRSGWIKSIADVSFRRFRTIQIWYRLCSRISIDRYQSNPTAKKFLNIYKSKL